MAPSDLENTTVTSSSITVEWVAPKKFGSYVIQIKKGSTLVNSPSVDPADTEETFSGLESAKEYTIILRAVTETVDGVDPVTSDDTIIDVYTREFDVILG